MVWLLLEFLGVAVAGVLVLKLGTWPYDLGVHIAVQQGYKDPSTRAFMLGWFFESIYLAAALALLVWALSRRRGERHVNLWVFWGIGTIVAVTSFAWIYASGNPQMNEPSRAERAATAPCPVDTGVYGSPKITMENIIGKNAAYANSQVLGFTNVDLISANPEYESVWEPKNWTVVSTDPAPGCSIGPEYHVSVYVTK